MKVGHYCDKESGKAPLIAATSWVPVSFATVYLRSAPRCLQNYSRPHLIHHFAENLFLIYFSFKSACIVCPVFVYQEPSRLFLQFFPAFQPPQTNASAPLPSQEDPSHCAEHLSPCAQPVQLVSEPQIT